MTVGRKRTIRTDLPTGLYFDPKWGSFYIRMRLGAGERVYKPLGKIGRDAAIKAWAKLVPDPLAAQGTVGELVDRYLTEELPRRERLGKVRAITAEGYRASARKLRAEFGARRLARTPAESMRPDVLRTLEVDAYLRKHEGTRGAIAANRAVALLSAMFTFGKRCGLTSYNPCEGAERNEERPRKRQLTADETAALLGKAAPVLRLMMRLAAVTSLRKTDVRMLRVQQVTPDGIDVTMSKTGARRLYAITPEVREVLDEAAKLPGRARSMFVFPTRKGTPYSESALQSMFRRLRERIGPDAAGIVFRDTRTTALNDARRAGADATGLAGHADERTTERHYLDEPKRVTPLR